jgi:hypothetical protein
MSRRGSEQDRALRLYPPPLSSSHRGPRPQLGHVRPRWPRAREFAVHEGAGQGSGVEEAWRLGTGGAQGGMTVLIEQVASSLADMWRLGLLTASIRNTADVPIAVLASVSAASRWEGSMPQGVSGPGLAPPPGVAHQQCRSEQAARALDLTRQLPGHPAGGDGTRLRRIEQPPRPEAANQSRGA